MGCALPVSHVYLGVLLNCDGNTTIFRSPPGRKYHIHSRDVNAARLPSQNNTSDVTDLFWNGTKTRFHYWAVTGQENRWKDEGEMGNWRVHKTHMHPEFLKPLCSKTFCGWPHQSDHMPTLPNSWARLSTSNRAVCAADSIDNSRPTTRLTSRAGSYILPVFLFEDLTELRVSRFPVRFQHVLAIAPPRKTRREGTEDPVR